MRGTVAECRGDAAQGGPSDFRAAFSDSVETLTYWFGSVWRRAGCFRYRVDYVSDFEVHLRTVDHVLDVETQVR
jgi:hypothetical protein